jgi:hypothetical protein
MGRAIGGARWGASAVPGALLTDSELLQWIRSSADRLAAMW